MAVTKIKVINITGCRLCISLDDGQKLFDHINKNLQEKKEIELSFQDVTNLTSAFLNAAIGQLYGSFPDEFIKKNLKVVDMEDDDKVILKRVVNRAKEYFRNPKPFEKAVNEVIGGSNE